MSAFDTLNSFKDMDAARLTKALSEHQNTIIKLVLGVGTLVLVGMIFLNYSSKDKAVHLQLSQEQQKLGVIKDRDASLVALNSFKASLPKRMNEMELITLLEDYAKSYHVSISSLSPAESQNMGLYDVLNDSFNATAHSFKDMMLFFKKNGKIQISYKDQFMVWQ